MTTTPDHGSGSKTRKVHPPSERALRAVVRLRHDDLVKFLDTLRAERPSVAAFIVQRLAGDREVPS